MKVLGLVPARGGSRRLPRKNLASLDGETLVRRCMRTALACEELDVIALSSEDPEILAEAEGLNRIVVIDRPAELAKAATHTVEVVLHTLKVVEGGGGPKFDAVVLLQCTSPFTRPEDISGTLHLLTRTGAASAVTVTSIDHAIHPLKLKRMVGHQLEPLFEDDAGRTFDELPDVWVRNGSVYVTRRELLKRGQIISSDCVGFPMPRERSIDINDAVDLAVARVLVQASTDQN